MNDLSSISSFLSGSEARLDDAMRDAIKTAMAPRPRQKPSEWAEANLHLPRTTTSKPGKLELFPFQRGILDALVEPDVDEIVIEKSSRTGYTQLMAIMELYCLEQTSSPVVSIHPKEASSRAFERKYIRPMVESSPLLRALIPDMETQPWKSKITSVGSTLDFKDAVLPDNFAEYSARYIFGDEVDRPQWAPGGEMTSEGDKLSLMMKRLESFDDGVMINGSSPGTDKASRIHPRFLMTDQRRYFVPCPHCGEYQYLKWGGRGADYGVQWKDRPPEKAYYVCEHNGCIIEHSEKLGMVERGEWRPTAEGLPGKVGFHLPALLSPFKKASWGALAVSFVKATREAAVGNTDSLQAFINTSLGEVWEEPDVGRHAEPHELEERREFYDAEVPAECLFVLGASDQQQGKEGEPGYSEVSFYGVAPGEQLWHIGHFVVRAGGLDDPAHWEKMAQLLSRKWKHASGREMEALAVSLDAGGSSKEVKAAQHVMDFCNRWQRKGKRWWPIQGYSNRQGKRRPPMWPSSPSSSKYGGKLYTIDTYLAKDAMFDRLQREPGTTGSVHFPTSPVASGIDGIESCPCDAVFFKRLTRERPKPLRGNPGVTTWAKQPKDQEPWDDLNYTYATLYGVYAMKGGSKIQEALQVSADEYAEMFEKKPQEPDRPVEVAGDLPLAPERPAEPDRPPRPWERPRDHDQDSRAHAPKPRRSGPQVIRSSFLSD